MTWPPGSKPLTAAERVAQLQRDADARRGVKPKGPPRRTMEWDFQEQLVAELRVLTIPPARFWFVPNGGNLSQAQRGRFKAMGLTPGVHDLHFAWGEECYERSWRTELFGRFGTLELKAGKGSASDEQDEFGRDMAAIGHRWAIAHAKDGVDGALATLRSWGFPLRRVR